MDRGVKERLVGATILVVLIVLIVPELLSGPKSRVAPPAAPPAAGTAEPLRNVTVDLATSKATPAESGAPSADLTAASAAPPPATGASAASAGPAPGAAAPPDSARGEAPVSAEPGAEVTPVGAPAATGRAGRSSPPPTIATLKAQQPAHAAEPALESEPPAPTSPSNARSTEAAPAGHHWAVQLGSFASRANADKLVRQLKAYDSPLYVSPSGKGSALRYRVRIGPLADREAAERVMVKLKKEGRPASLVAP